MNEEYALEVLIKHSRVSPSDAHDAQEKAEPGGAVNYLIQNGLISEMDLLQAEADEAGLTAIETIGTIPEDIVKTIPAALVHKLQVVPIGRQGDILRVAIRNPFNLEALDLLGKEVPFAVEAVVAPESEIQNAIKRFFTSATGALDEMTKGAADDLVLKETGVESETVTDTDGHIMKMVNSLITDAYKLKASDIHIEPMEKRLRIRFRIDGVLQVMPDVPKKLQMALIGRLKIMSKMSIAERRIPQDGRIQIKLEGDRAIDLRVSTLPITNGEGVVMRILDKTSLTLGLPQLGFLSDDQAVMERILNLPDGIFLVTGPTGSGKSTTLYACLNSINKPDRKIITVEDPVEYQLSGINQVPVNAEVGMTFAAALRAMLRQAPNIIMIGEIRDDETASIAVNASLTGHLVFSTLHTNDAPSAVTRLVDIGVKPFLVSSAVRAIMAQRLIRKICGNCTEAYVPSELEMKGLNVKPEQMETANFRKGRGCEKCRGTGFKGRLGIFEIFLLDDEIRRLINERASVSMIRQRARDLGMRTLREDGIRKVLGGITTPDEVLSATMGDKD